MRLILIKNRYLMFFNIASFEEICNNIISDDVDDQKISRIKKCIIYSYGRLLSSLFLDNQGGKLFRYLQIGVKV